MALGDCLGLPFLSKTAKLLALGTKRPNMAER